MADSKWSIWKERKHFNNKTFANQEERRQKWKEHFEILFGNPPEGIYKTTKKFINTPLNINIGQFTEEELDTVLKRIKIRNAAGLNEILSKLWKTKKFDDILRLCNAVNKENTIQKWKKDCVFFFP